MNSIIQNYMSAHQFIANGSTIKFTPFTLAGIKGKRYITFARGNSEPEKDVSTYDSQSEVSSF